MLGTLAHAGLMRLGGRGMPRMMHDMIFTARDVFAHMRAVSCGMLHRLARLDGGRLRLGLDRRSRAIRAGCA